MTIVARAEEVRLIKECVTVEKCIFQKNVSEKVRQMGKTAEYV